MTVGEFEREFDILYNNIMSDAAPSIDSYEKSVFLTKAQEEIVTALYDGSFEHTEKTTEYLDVLVVTETLDSDKSLDVLDPTLNSKKISTDSKFFRLKNDAMFITYEELRPKDSVCGDKIKVLVKPTKQDEYFRVSNNPFRRARSREALRLNIEGMLEIVSTYHDYNYIVRYIRKPYPIILYDEPSLTIDGKSAYRDINAPCELSPVVQRAILERAVEMAVSIYKKIPTTN